MNDEPLDHLTTNASSNQSGSNDFVKKLFQMLQQDNYKSIVRWTKNGDSFVVIDTNEFTKDILPRHFKHSNFASFVRQLNKYDFHKVKISNEAKRNYEYGDDAWEFKHPEFRMNDRDALENIKRKGPTTKKPNGSVDGTNGNIHQELLTNVKLLQDNMDMINKDNAKLIQEVNILKSKYKSVVDNLVIVKSFNERYVNLMNILINSLTQNGIKLPQLDFPNPNDDFMTKPPSHSHSHSQSHIPQLPQILQPSQPSQLPPSQPQPLSQPPPPSTQPPPPSSSSAQPIRDHKRLYSHQFNQSPPSVMANQPSQPTSSINPSTSGNSTTPPLPSAPGSSQLPPSQTFATGTPNSNDQSPLESPRNGVNDLSGNGAVLTGNGSVLTTNIPDPKFHVLLVEDDNVCIQLCRKFLVKYGCQVTVVTDGLNAISTVENHKYDLVLMDIVMPNLDGATATSVIRSFDTKTPIIAMTGNIEENDLVTYLQNGMSDILAKPFTKDDLYSILSKHLLGNEPINAVGMNGEYLNNDPVLKKQRLE